MIHRRLPDRRFWKYSPGSGAARWSEDTEQGIMAIDFSDYKIGPLDQYKSYHELVEAAGIQNPSRSNNGGSMFSFVEANKDDVVIASKGRNTIVGIGLIAGPYEYQNNSSTPYDRHHREVNWLATKTWTYTENLFSGHKTLFRIEAFCKTLLRPEIINEYVKQYSEYRPVFEQHNLLEPSQLLDQPLEHIPEPSMTSSKNIILYGPPGTSKTYGTIDLAVDIVDGRKDDEHTVNKHRFDQLREERQIEFITFHQNYTYEDFVMGIKPVLNGNALNFQLRTGVFYNIAKLASVA